MKKLFRLTLASFLSVLVITNAFAQEDISRRNELPNRIGGNTCTNRPNEGASNLQGSVNITGALSTEKTPTITVVVYGSGMYLSRQRVKNGGSFMFTCLPANSVTLTVEVDGIEVASFALGSLTPPPGNNRQDLIVNWSDVGEMIRKKQAVISSRNLYKRDAKNQKIFDKAMSEVDEKKFETAIKTLDKLLSDDPADFAAWTEKGYILLDSGKFAEAVESFSKAISAKSSEERSVVGLGRSYIGLKNYERAIELLTKADLEHPNSADINHYLGEAHLYNRKGSLAIVHMNKAIELDPVEKAALHMRMANLYHAAGAKHLAANEYKLFLQKVPNHPDRPKMEAYIKENSSQND